MESISVVIPVYNVEPIVEDCLRTIKWVDEIICIDMGSSDNTRAACEAFGAIVIKNIPKNNNFDINRKIGMEKAKSAWILKIDSDDRLTRKLQNSIKEILNNKPKANGYKLYNRVFFFNKEIKFGMKKAGSNELRLVKNGKWSYFPRSFHQQIKVRGRTDFLEGAYLHFNSQSIEQFLSKMNRYTDLDVKQGPYSRNVSFLHLVLSPTLKLVRYLLFRLGFLDGTHGLIVSLLYVIYNFIYKLKIWEKRIS
jgi:glycosyltransferase involved in cell wall biosynthesis